MKPAGTRIEDPDVLLLRQVPSIHLPRGLVSSAAFIPGPDHGSLLSTRHESLGADRAYEEFVALAISTEGTWGVTVGEVEGNGVCAGIAAFLDEFVNAAPQGHVSIDFNPSPGVSATKRIAKHLARRANDRGKLYPA